MARDEVIRELCDERIVSNFDTIVNLNTSVYSNEKGKKNLAFFFLTRLLTDSLIKLSGQNKRKEKKKREFSFGSRNRDMRLFYPRFKFVI